MAWNIRKSQLNYQCKITSTPSNIHSEHQLVFQQVETSKKLE